MLDPRKTVTELVANLPDPGGTRNRQFVIDQLCELITTIVEDAEEEAFRRGQHSMLPL